MSRAYRYLGLGILAAGAIAIAACESPTVPPRVLAYRFTYADSIVYRWPVGETIGVHVLPSSDADLRAHLSDAVDHALSSWNEAVLYGQYRLVRVPLERADVVIAWAEDPMPLDLSVCPPVAGGVAWTTFCTNDDTTAIGAYPLTSGEHRSDGVHMIVQVLASQSTVENRVAALVTHELGHVLGIGRHPCRLGEAGCPSGYGAQNSIMFAGLPDQLTPSQEDAATIELVYQTRATYMPEPSP